MASSPEIVPAEDTNPILAISQVNTEAEPIEKPTSINFPDHPIKNSFSISFLGLRKLFKTTHKRLQPSKPGEENERDEILKEQGALLKLINADLMFIQDTWKRSKHHGQYAEKASKMFEELKDLGRKHKDLHETRSVVKALKHQMSTDQLESGDTDLDLHLVDMLRESNTYGANIDGLGEIGGNLFEDQECFEKTSEFKYLESRFFEIPLALRLCLLCFSVFPENSEIKRRVLINWWIGEGFVPPSQVVEQGSDRIREGWVKYFDLKEEFEKTPEGWANCFFDKLIEVGFIVSAHRKPKPKVNICRMQPFVRFVVNRLAERVRFFEFDGEGNVSDQCSNSLQACLFEGKELADDKTLEKLHTVFNVNAGFLYLSHELLSRMRNVNVLYLGRWKFSVSSQIEIVSRKISKARSSSNALDALKYMKHLRFLSLQGMSRIRTLPKSIFELELVTILDIRACRDLQNISEEIGRLVNLTHLDMSECYLLNKMPKGISRLTKLQVLKGFICGGTQIRSCTLDDLKSFPDLTKLSIRTASDLFPSEKDLRALNQFRSLTKLTIAWESKSAQNFYEENPSAQISQNNHRSSKSENFEKDVHMQQESQENSFQEIKSPNGGSKKHWKNKEIVEDEKETQKKSKPSSQGEEIQASKHIENIEGEERVNLKDDDILETKNSKSLGRPPSFIPLLSNGIRDHKKKTIVPRKKQPIRAMAGAYTLALPELPSQLIKLDLQCFPGTTKCDWFHPPKLMALEKLYIRGGNCCDLGQFHDFDYYGLQYTWKVKELRLKYLNELEMDWMELSELFPELSYLEKVNCPKLSFFQCDARGIWMKDTIG